MKHLLALTVSLLLAGATYAHPPQQHHNHNHAAPVVGHASSGRLPPANYGGVNPYYHYHRHGCYLNPLLQLQYESAYIQFGRYMTLQNLAYQQALQEFLYYGY